MKKILIILLVFLGTLGIAQDKAGETLRYNSLYGHTFSQDWEIYVDECLSNLVKDTIKIVMLREADTTYYLLRTPRLQLEPDDVWSEFTIIYLRPQEISMEKFLEWYTQPLKK